MFDTLFEIDPPKSQEELETEKWIVDHNLQFTKDKSYKPVTTISALDPKEAEKNAIMLIRSTLYAASRRYSSNSAKNIACTIDAESSIKEGKLPAHLAVRRAILRS